MSQRTRKPRMILQRDGRVVIAGLNYRDARYLLTLASNRLYDAEATAREQHAGALPYSDSYRFTRWILEELEQSLAAQLDATHGSTPEPSLKERLRESHELRLLVDRALERARKQAEDKPAAAPEAEPQTGPAAPAREPSGYSG